MMKIQSPNGSTYHVDEKRIGSTDVFTLYECILPDGAKGILKIAVTPGDNGLLDHEAYLLQMMTEEAIIVEEEYKHATSGTKSPLNNHFFFPQLVETFICPEQENRRVTILSFSHIAENLPDLMPISFITRDNLRVDPKTSAWIIGKLLKFLVFVHGEGINLGSVVHAENILLNSKEHYVCIFDWTEAQLNNNEVSEESAGKDIAAITKEILTILGASEDGVLPVDDQLADNQYQDFLGKLLSGDLTKAFNIHNDFYNLIWSIWPRGFHPYTTKFSKQ